MVIKSSFPDLHKTRILRPWLEECTTKHLLCASSMPLSILPKRVIDITSLDQIFLIESKGRSADYVALSYCWGTPRHPDMMLFGPESKGKKGGPDPEPNIEAHRSRIIFRRMPKTLQDAVLVTYKLGFQYIWIDSLCIVQGDDREWRKENLTLGGIYSNAVLVIAASCAANMDVGFLTTLPDTRNQRRIAAEEALLARSAEFTHLRPLALRSEPLNRRAWALSEAALANRIVHFTSSGMIWECNELRRHERGHTQLIDQYDPDSFQLLRGRDAAQKCSITDLYNKWRDFVEHFTQRIINSGPKETDKDHRRMMAIARVAQRFSEICLQVFHRDDSYLAGMWEGDLRTSLLWSVEKGLVEGGSAGTRRPITYMAPTWSWASVEGSVSFERFSKFESSITHVEVAVEPLKDAMSWGEPWRGKLEVEGKVLHELRVKPHQCTGSAPVTRHHVTVYLPGTSIACNFVSDVPNCDTGHGQKYSCLDLGRGSRAGNTDGREWSARFVVLLRRVMDSGSNFERVGISCRNGDDSLSELVERMETDKIVLE